MEKNATTIRLAKMNLAVHGLEGDIQKAITYYEDPHELLGKAEYVMANPPFNVDEIDAEKVKTDPRIPFSLPGVNKKGKVSNGNYIWDRGSSRAEIRWIKMAVFGPTCTLFGVQLGYRYLNCRPR